MYWLVASAVIGIGKLIYDSITEEEKQARITWEIERVKVERSIEDHQKNIELNLKKAQESYNFHFLTDLHFSSHIIANSAYKLLESERVSINAINKMLKESISQKIFLFNQIKNAKKTKDKNKLTELNKEFKLIKDFRKNLFDDREKLYEQSSKLKNKVKSLNIRTGELKLIIKNRCGLKGNEWYKKLEHRKSLKK